jgi:hypothetical protein
MVDYQAAAARLRDISDHADGFLSSTITREPAGSLGKPPTPGQPLLWADEWHENDVLYRIAIEGHGNAPGDLCRRLRAVVSETGAQFNPLMLSAHEDTGCRWRPIPSKSISEALQLSPQELTEESDDDAEVPSLSRCADLVAAVIKVLDAKSQSASREPATDQELARHRDVGNRSADSAGEDPSEGQVTKFDGGTMVFHSNRVELCGANICSGRRSRRQRAVLDLLRMKNADGQFQAYSSNSIAEKVGLKDASGVPALIRDLRTQISKRLHEQVGIECGREEVILSGDQGYRLSHKLSVQDAEDLHGAGLQGHEPGGAAGPDPDHEPNDRDRDPIGDPRDEPIADLGGDPIADADDPTEERQKWILNELGKGRKLTAPLIADELNCSHSTARRDLEALKAAGEIEHVGSTRYGHYRLTDSE